MNGSSQIGVHQIARRSDGDQLHRRIAAGECEAAVWAAARE
jgi:hypothetical protein